MQHVNNFGSVLQAYALSRIVASYGCEVSFLEIKKIDEDYGLAYNNKLDFSAEVEKKGILGKVQRLCKYPYNRLLNKGKEKEQNIIFDEFREKFDIISKNDTNIDLCIIGSDEVFNCLNSGYWGFSSQLFGNIPESSCVITYAASCGATMYDQLPQAIVDKIRESFKNISGFSVRDKNTHDFVENFTDKTVFEHLDPVLVYDFNKEIQMVTLPKLPKRYCIIYSYRNRIKDSEEIKMILEFCKRYDFTTVSIGAPQYWTREYIPCTPFECLKIFEQSEFVITDTFHGTIFSYKYAKHFAIIKRKSNLNKLNDLIQKLSIQEHVLDGTTLDNIFNNERDRQRINEFIDLERKKTMEYLSHYLYKL